MAFSGMRYVHKDSLHEDFLSGDANLSRSKKYSEAVRFPRYIGTCEKNTICKHGFDSGLASHCPWVLKWPEQNVQVTFDADLKSFSKTFPRIVGGDPDKVKETP